MIVDSNLKYYSEEMNCSGWWFSYGMVQKDRGFTGEYRYGYQGSEKDDEISGSGNSYTTFYRGLDPRLGRWKSIDPKATAWESPFASMGNNPILYNDVFGDTVFVDRKGYVNDKDINLDGSLTDNLVYMKTSFLTRLFGGAEYVSIGELTQNVDANIWFDILLRSNSIEALNDANTKIIPLKVFKEKIKQNSKWDYKNLNSTNKELGKGGRKEHLLGLAFQLKKDTDFSFDGKSGYRSEDLNNFHFGVIALATGVPKFLGLYAAGFIEQKKWNGLVEDNKTLPSNEKKWINPNYENWGSTYGDNPKDHRNIKEGYEYFKTKGFKGPKGLENIGRIRPYNSGLKW